MDYIVSLLFKVADSAETLSIWGFYKPRKPFVDCESNDNE